MDRVSEEYLRDMGAGVVGNSSSSISSEWLHRAECQVDETAHPFGQLDFLSQSDCCGCMGVCLHSHRTRSQQLLACRAWHSSTLLSSTHYRVFKVILNL